MNDTKITTTARNSARCSCACAHSKRSSSKTLRRSGRTRRDRRNVQTRIGRVSRRIVARAWSDPDFNGAYSKTRRPPSMPKDTRARSAATSSRLRIHGVHNMVVCTLCSCYPWEVLDFRRCGTSRHRIVRAPSAIRRGCSPISVSRCARYGNPRMDSTARRASSCCDAAAGTDRFSEDQLAALVTRDSMIGTGVALQPEDVAQ